jgi:hypothetical protein
VSGRAALRAALLLVVALAIQVGVARPAVRQRDFAQRQYAHEREERERLRVRVTDLERRAAARDGTLASDPSAAARALRAALLGGTTGVAVQAVQIASSAAQAAGGVAARGHLAATGRLSDVLQVAGRLVRPRSGVLLERVQIVETGNPGQVRIELDGFSLQEGS